MDKIEGKFVNQDFFKETQNGPIVVGSHCLQCGRVYFPRKRVCPDCWKIDEMEEVPLAKRGRLLTYSVAFQSAVGIKTPYAFGYVELEDGVRLYSLLTDCEPFEERLYSGCPVEMVIEFMAQDDYGQNIYCYKCRPIEEAKGQRRKAKGSTSTGQS